MGRICLVVGRSDIGEGAALTYFAGARRAERVWISLATDRAGRRPRYAGLLAQAFFLR